MLQEPKIDENPFSAMTVPKDYIEKLGKEEWVYKNLIIKGQITTIVASSGFGKTSIMFFLVAPFAARQKYKVVYFDLDSPTNDHNRMFNVKEEAGFDWVNPNVKRGLSLEKIMETLEGLSNSDQDLSEYVLFFDTLKKFNDMMSKSGTKDFFILMRKLVGKGATIVLLAHTNKRKEADGNATYEGVGDVKSDSDALIMLEADHYDDRICVTTIVDMTNNPNVKVRGIYQPISFRIWKKDRKVEEIQGYISESAKAKNLNKPPSDNEIIETAYQCIEESQGDLDKTSLIKSIRNYLPDAAYNRVSKLLEKYIHRKGQDKNGEAFFETLKKGKRRYCMYQENELETNENDHTNVG